jgi:hypothetical protein
MIEREDPLSVPVWRELMCRVMSARTIQLNGKRAIYVVKPYRVFAEYFRSDDGDHIFCEAEYKVLPNGEGALNVYGRARTNLKEWVLYSQTAEQVAAASRVFN